MDDRKCHWCRAKTQPGRRNRVMMVNGSKFYFHGKCLEKFKEHNPEAWRRSLEAVAQRTY